MPYKRANGQGSVYKRGHYWVAQVTIGYNEKGQARYKRKGGFRTKTEALEALPQIKELAEQKPVPTVAYYYRAFCNGRGSQISEDKARAYEIAYNRLKPVQTTAINELTIPQLQTLLNETCQSYYPARDMRSLLNHLFRLAAVDGNANPALPGLLTLPRLHESPREAFTDEEQILLWDSYEAGNLAAALPLIMIHTGLMTGEIRRLSASNVDLGRQLITGIGLKTDERRSKPVIIPDAIVPLLQDLMDRIPEGPFFPQRDDDFYALYYGALTSAGVNRHLTPYACRHTTATALAVNGQVAPQTVQRIMRWSSTKMMDRYVHPDDEAARKAAQKI